MLLGIDFTMTSQLIEGRSTPNLYSLLFVTGMIIGYFVIRKMFRKEGIDDAVLDKLVMYIVPATIIGARLGHVFFYGPYWDFVDNCGVMQEGYFEHPLSILYVWEGGLASHGGAIVILVALWYFSKKVINKPILWILDRIAAPIAIAGMFIRLGNLFNHEIVGDPTNVPWAFSFSQYYNDTLCGYDSTPRHPAQLYEAICYFISFGILMFLFWKRDLWKKPGVIFGVFLILIFGARFIIEYVKTGQTARDEYMLLNTGQLLSIPFILIGIYLIIRSNKQQAIN